MNVLATPRITFGTAKPNYLELAAESFKNKLIERSIPAESLNVTGGFKEGMPMIDIIVPTPELRDRVILELHQFQGAIPFYDNVHVNFKVARVRVKVAE